MRAHRTTKNRRTIAGRKNESGMAILEFAMSLVFVVPLLVGVVDFSMYLRAGHALSQAAREGTILAARGTDPAPTVLNYLQSAGYDPDKATVEVTDTAVIGSETTVRVGYDLTGHVVLPWESMLPAVAQLEITNSARRL